MVAGSSTNYVNDPTYSSYDRARNSTASQANTKAVPPFVQRHAQWSPHVKITKSCESARRTVKFLICNKTSPRNSDLIVKLQPSS